MFETFRAQFPIFRSKIYLNSCSQGAMSLAVEEAYKDYFEIWHDRGSPWDRWIHLEDELRLEFASLIHSEPEAVAVTFSASTAINSIASCLDYRERRRVVMGELEFPTQCHIWLAQEARGAEVRWVPSPGGRNAPEDYLRHIDDQTLIVPLTHVCFRNGFRNDVGAITRIAKEAGALILLDDYQSCGTRPVDVTEMGVDIYVAGALKYLLGSSGVAFLYVKKEKIEGLSPLHTGWLAQREPFAFRIHRHEPADTAVRFQSGSPPVPAMYSALAGLRLLRRIGLENVRAGIAGLTRLFIRMASERSWSLKTPLSSEGPLVVVHAENPSSAQEIVRALEHEQIIVSYRDDGVRVSFHAYNNEEDVHAVVEALSKVQGRIRRVSPEDVILQP